MNKNTNKNKYEYKTDMLYNYMKKRATVEKQKWELSKDYLEEHFQSGIRSFFGVLLSDDGIIMGDENCPKLPNGRNFLIETVGAYCGFSLENYWKNIKANRENGTPNHS